MNFGSPSFSELKEATAEPYVIAEIGVNHEGCFDRAIRLIDLAKEGGADAAKFQTYKAESLATKSSPAYWDLSEEPTTSQYTLFKKYDRFNAEDYVKLAEHCQKVGIDFLSTPFDQDSIEFLDPIMGAYKIASADITNIPFLVQVARKKKPIILSTGAANLDEINLAVKLLQNSGAECIAILHCVLNYPTENKNANLGMITSLKENFPDLVIGYSDHTLPDEKMKSLITAYTLGARIIEKHFTYDKTLPGNDHYHSMDVNDLRCFRHELRSLKRLLGSYHKAPLDSEEPARTHARRSIVAAKTIPMNSRIIEEHLTYKRPGTGIPISKWNEIIGLQTKNNIEKDALLKIDDLETPNLVKFRTKRMVESLLICGLGSVGQRHLLAFRKLGIKNVFAYRTGLGNLQPADGNTPDREFISIEEALSVSPDAVVISNPTALHADIALKAIEKNCHVLVEKPLSHNLSECHRLLNASKKGDQIAIVGCNLRFYPHLATLKQLTEKQTLGRPLTASATFGAYLPKWHPWEDYLTSYASREELGGGATLTHIHELDYLQWILGGITDVRGLLSKQNPIGTKVDEMSTAIFRHESGAISNAMLSLCHQPPRRDFHINYELGSAKIDFISHTLEIRSKDGDNLEIESLQDYDYQDSYLLQAKNFLKAIETRESGQLCHLESGCDSVKIALKIKEACNG